MEQKSIMLNENVLSSDFEWWIACLRLIESEIRKEELLTGYLYNKNEKTEIFLEEN